MIDIVIIKMVVSFYLLTLRSKIVTMEWKKLKIVSSADAMDPGIVHSSSTVTVRSRDELKLGQRVPYDDPGGALPSIKVAEISPETLVLQVGERKVEIGFGKYTRLASAGRDYTNFTLEARLE